MKNFGEQFLHQKDQKLHTSDSVEHEKKRKKRSGEEVSEKPILKITDWLKVIEKTHMGHKDDPKVFERIKTSYHKQYVIKPENVPESTFLLEQKIARAQGHGTIEITDSFKQQKTQEIIGNQEKSLDKWIDYLSSSDAAYPMWAKYWAFNSMLKMGKIEKKEDENTKAETTKFIKREKNTTASFPPLNPRALAMTISAIEAKAQENVKDKKGRKEIENMSVKLNEADFKDLLNTENFSKIYTQFLIEMPEYSKEGLKETRGKWVKYEQGSEPDELVKSLEGYPLEWCTANIDTARTQLQGGDFYVFYSINEDSEAKIPRVAIRMEEDNIAEIRGIAPDQNMDPYIGGVVSEKMNEFPDAKQYEKKSTDMKKLTKIEEKNNQKQELTREELKFLYEIESKIEGFGYANDPRIFEIRNTRNKVNDYRIIFDAQNDSDVIFANKLIDVGETILVLEFISSFKNLTSTIAVKLIDAGETEAVMQNTNAFCEYVPSNDFFKKVIEKKQIDVLGRNIKNIEPSFYPYIFNQVKESGEILKFLNSSSTNLSLFVPKENQKKFILEQIQNNESKKEVFHYLAFSERMDGITSTEDVSEIALSILTEGHFDNRSLNVKFVRNMGGNSENLKKLNTQVFIKLIDCYLSDLVLEKVYLYNVDYNSIALKIISDREREELKYGKKEGQIMIKNFDKFTTLIDENLKVELEKYFVDNDTFSN